MNTIIFDIETGPLPVEQIEIPPFEPPANIKDPEKIAAREAAYKKEYVEQAALGALTGTIVAIGLAAPGKAGEMIAKDTEADTIRGFLAVLEELDWPRLAGFNIATFDLPFLFRRCWALEIGPPIFKYRRDRYWNDDRVLDLREVWQLGDRMAKGSLDSISKCLGTGRKNGEGKDFAALLKSDRKQAEGYLLNDLELTWKVYQRMYPVHG
jgi:uncharacterized protein YprB with RNaseH-like and TPR domain